MADVVITLKIMPESPDTDLAKIAEQAKTLITADGGHVHSTENKPVAFGLEAIHIVFSKDEAKGSSDELEEAVAKISHVNSVDVIDVRRAFG
ncbi:MAG: elongation factor 1-beta [DPANN group archaeon]|nr:elongation factor 1-beta [DPANN group archaeon]